MITALQNFISKQSKILFPVLLLVIVVSFVLYLSQGSSIFDLLPDPTREKKELYGVDLNDPNQRRIINQSNRVASDFGAIVSPTDEAMENADRQFLGNLQNQFQAAIQANQGDIDRNALQRLYGFMQQWPNLPKKSIKVKKSLVPEFMILNFPNHLSSLRLQWMARRIWVFCHLISIIQGLMLDLTILLNL